MGAVKRRTGVAILAVVALSAGVSGAAAPVSLPGVEQGAAALLPAQRVTLTQPLAAVTPSILGTCPAHVHDRYVVFGPDGLPYRTWHPQVVPLDPAQPNGPTCRFAHEHGDDPRTSLADPTLPAFGYAAAMHGMEEAHEGFKVFVINRGTRNDEGRVATTSTRLMVHMGTGGPKRFTLQHHTMEFDLVASDGHEIHVHGMADTALGGSICERDRSLGDANPANDVGRTFVVTPGNGCNAEGSLYEIWQFRLDVGAATVVASAAVFDPITVMNPADRSVAVPTHTVYPQFGVQRGCARESYHGPVYWYHPTGPKVFHTFATGYPVPPDMPRAIEQFVSNHTDIGIRMNQDQGQMKLLSNHCAAGLGALN